MIEKNKSKEYITGLSQYLKTHIHQEGIIVCEERKFIYMKPTKTAGSSILRGVLNQQEFRVFHKKDHPIVFNKWIDSIDDKDLEDYFIFSVVRNPWDRLVSVAAYFKIPIKEFISNIDHYWQDPEIKKHSFPLHYYTHYQGKLFADFICRFETLQADMNLVFDRIGIERIILPHAKKTDHHHYSAYYNDETRTMVEELYAEDIKLCGYVYETQPPSLWERTYHYLRSEFIKY